ETVYVVFSAPVQQERSLPWQPVRVSATLPQDLAPQEVVLKGRLKNGRIDYGIEEIYIPENQRDRMNAQIAEASQREQLLVEVKVDAGGRALVRAIWLQGQRYQF
ncbi:MAG: GDYXXLXY domain-containing protein, partial [Gloeomargarita sp. GXS_bins_116]